MSNLKLFWKKHPRLLRVFGWTMLVLAPFTFLYCVVAVVIEQWDDIELLFAEVWDAAMGRLQ